MIVRTLDETDRGYALSSWRESHKQAPGVDRVPWPYYRTEWGAKFHTIINDPATRLLGAYDGGDLLGWLAMTPGKRVQTLHWCYVKWKVGDSSMRRRGIMTALLNGAELGTRFAYTLQGRRLKERLPDGSMSKSLDELLVAALRARGISATYVPLKEFLQ